jgi:hypothetical protein
MHLLMDGRKHDLINRTHFCSSSSSSSRSSGGDSSTGSTASDQASLHILISFPPTTRTLSAVGTYINYGP